MISLCSKSIFLNLDPQHSQNGSCNVYGEILPRAKIETLISNEQIGRRQKYNEPCTGFPIRDAQWIWYQKSIFHIILPSLSSLSRSGIFRFLRNGRLFWETLYFISRHVDVDISCKPDWYKAIVAKKIERKSNLIASLQKV